MHHSDSNRQTQCDRVLVCSVQIVAEITRSKQPTKKQKKNSALWLIRVRPSTKEGNLFFLSWLDQSEGKIFTTNRNVSMRIQQQQQISMRFVPLGRLTMFDSIKSSVKKWVYGNMLIGWMLSSSARWKMELTHGWENQAKLEYWTAWKSDLKNINIHL